MKREDVTTPTPSIDWQSDADALLESIDDVTWDELRGLSPPQTPVEVIRGASPIQSPAGHVLTLRSSTGSRIGGDEQEPLTSLMDGMDAFGAMPMMDTPLSWSRLGSAQVLDCGEAPHVSAMERRRQKNRDCMRRARQKQRDEMDNMKLTVARLEKQYAELSFQSQHSDSRALVGVASGYAEAVEVTRRLGAENLYLKAEIQQQAAWKLNLSRVLQSCHEMEGPRWAQQFQQPSLGGEAVLRMRLDERDQFEAADEFGFHPLSDLGLTQVILDNHRTISRVQSQLLIPSSSDSDFGARTRRMQTFGWEMVQRVHGNIMESVFTKRFYGLNVAELMQKTWANDMRLGEFKKVKGETSRLEVLQQVNPNAYVLCRDVMSPTEDISTFRSVFVRFLIETSKRIPASRAASAPTGIDASAPSTPPQYADSDSDCEELMLEATGYVLGTQSFDTDYSRNPRPEDIRNKVAWAHLSLSIEFLNVVNPATGEEYQQLRWSARTDYCGPQHAQRNASDMMQGLLRWELLVIAPALNLFSLSLE
ncbi:hypothetical protein KRP22_004586 [Phytophthora ramorum]|nr:hypothetical protein KRP22_14234 [Phytophthora ramorum]